MKKLFIIANWKSYKTAGEAKEWLHGISNFKFPISNDKEKVVVVCPPFPLLPLLRESISSNNGQLAIGSQDVSPFDEGAYTGEVNAKQIKEFADYAIIGHSERRKNFAETDEMLSLKVQKALEQHITPIFCVQGVETPIPDGVTLVAYEPVWAIGSGHPATAENAESVAKTIKENHNAVNYVLYGGSVTPDDVNGFTQMDHIDGVLVGGASLDIEKFAKIIENS